MVVLYPLEHYVYQQLYVVFFIIFIKKVVSIKIYEHYNSKLPKMFDAIAMTFGHHIFYEEAKQNVEERYRVHESKHVEQYEKDGFFGFLLKYLKEYIIGRLKGYNHYDSYYRISYEVEAYEVERMYENQTNQFI